MSKLKRSKVAILGMAGGYSRAPFHTHDWEVWGLNDAYRLLATDNGELPVDRWFELHPNSDLTRRRRPVDYQERLAAITIPIYTLWEGNPWKVKHPRVYPLAKAVRLGRDYFACTFAYQIALALLEGFTTIGVYGAPLVGAREGLVERPCVEWWLGFAAGRGVTVVVDHDEPMGLGRQQYPYALQDQYERRAAAAYVHWNIAISEHWLYTESERTLGRPSGYRT